MPTFKTPPWYTGHVVRIGMGMRDVHVPLYTLQYLLSIVFHKPKLCVSIHRPRVWFVSLHVVQQFAAITIHTGSIKRDFPVAKCHLSLFNSSINLAHIFSSRILVMSHAEMCAGLLRRFVQYIRDYNFFPNHTTLYRSTSAQNSTNINSIILLLVDRILNSSSSLQLISDCDKRNHG